jgi:hypothetical protein
MRELHQIVMTDARQEAVYRNKRQLERLQQERGLLPTRKRMTTDLPQPILKGSDKEVRAHRPKHTPKPQERQVIRDLTGSGHGTSVKHVLPPGLAEQFTAEEVHELSKASLRKERRRKKESRGDDES